ncbi:hypothetical protein LO762_25675 [Actinocorallia sp. API 0066]|uniref:hypothetical protein n=1 Tax=Actinocorallia sp. API 0066 TaxID=2896846 RepID=UPI001E556335|nr:hypothetical protein [Actinocorallia sp. API 0066]MCD0452549.1 hypothetical protein [Actinocorallia sp. API 0066]
MRLRRVLATAALLPLSACGGGDTDHATACDGYKTAINTLGTTQVGVDFSDPSTLTAPYGDAARQIRSIADSAADEGVSKVGDQIATALDEVVTTATSGAPSTDRKSLAASGRLADAVAAMERECGPIS